MPEFFIQEAITLLRREFDVLGISDVWETPSYGTSGPDFLNAAMLISTSQPVEFIKEFKLRPIENQLGRIRTNDKFAPRTIDLDIIIWNGYLLDQKLWELPHIAVPVSQLLPCFKSREGEKALVIVANMLKKTGSIIYRPDVMKL
jgi:2-amino-4-hydroxy-6-hydroxymethyldihydropteridine diphosphokinase